MRAAAAAADGDDVGAVADAAQRERRCGHLDRRKRI